MVQQQQTKKQTTTTTTTHQHPHPHPQHQPSTTSTHPQSSAKDNVILLHIGLSASSHAKSHDLNKSFGWWEKFIGHGPNYPIDLDRYFVICTNVLGSCYGSTGPPHQSTQRPMSLWDPFPNHLNLLHGQSSVQAVGSSQYFQAFCQSSKGSKDGKHQWLWKNRSIKYCFTICSKVRKSLLTPSFSNLQHSQKRLLSLVSHSPEHQSSLSVQLANHSSAIMDSGTSLKPINDSNNVQNQSLRVKARGHLKDNRRSGKLLMEEVDQEHCIL
ncbi:hypothetical protein PPACK8108_LOCUS17699 [Phakopsora pachyrhizi]|uniref:Homoserine O-acetyltransferase n=1 Tax=Phakopsora pachyrhizi TaxID=170000 RepID=A0AAV0BCE3_PHAPC|nr:hypothetical protein PPACK8108_LOCUS17699 [Phakopsora pachyrhizi]